jgi:beta-lactamase class A
MMNDLPGLIAREMARLTCDYALYFRRAGQEPIFLSTDDLFPSASIIKVPILFAWAQLERSGEVDRAELCDLDAEPAVQGAGLSWLLRARRLPYADVLLLMIALSDNLCTNLVIRRIGIERLNQVFRKQLGLQHGTRLERKLMDYAARSRGLDNWVSARDAIQLFAVLRNLTRAERSWIDPLFEACVDGGLWLRNIPRDTVPLRHKTGSIAGALHDWGYTDDSELFILTRNVRDESEVYRALDVLGPALLAVDQVTELPSAFDRR